MIEVVWKCSFCDEQQVSYMHDTLKVEAFDDFTSTDMFTITCKHCNKESSFEIEVSPIESNNEN